MKIEIFEKAEQIRKQRKQFEAARDAITKMIDQKGAQLDLVDDNDEAANVNLEHIEARNRIEKMIGELDAQFDAL